MRRTHPPQDPLEPIKGTVGCLTGLTGLFLLLSLLVHQALWGNGPVCTSVPALGIPTGVTAVAVDGQVRGSQATIGDVVLLREPSGYVAEVRGPALARVMRVGVTMREELDVTV